MPCGQLPYGPAGAERGQPGAAVLLSEPGRGREASSRPVLDDAPVCEAGSVRASDWPFEAAPADDCDEEMFEAVDMLAGAPFWALAISEREAGTWGWWFELLSPLIGPGFVEGPFERSGFSRMCVL